MDGEDSKQEGQIKNKQCSNQKTNSNNQQSNHHSPESLVQPEGGGETTGCSESSQPDTTCHDCSHFTLSPSGDHVVLPQGVPTLYDRRLSLSGGGAANGASSATSPVNAVVKASGTGTASGSSQYHIHNNRRENMMSSTTDFLVNFPALICSSCISPSFGKSGQHAGSCSANSGKIANGECDIDVAGDGHLFFPSTSPPGLSPPQNQGQAFYNWQATKTSVKERLAYLYNTGTMTDIQFKVK